MPMISTGVRYMGDLIKMMVGNKKRAVFEDTSVMQEVMREVKEGAVTFQKELAAKAYEVERERVKQEKAAAKRAAAGENKGVPKVK